jgi:hypothetical protein
MKKMGEEMGEDVSDVEAMLEQPGDDDAGPIEHSGSF